MKGTCASGGTAAALHDRIGEAIDGLVLHLVAEARMLLARAAKTSPDETRTIFAEWDRGELGDRALRSTADALGIRDDDGEPLLDKVLDSLRGPEPCAAAAALAAELGVPAPSFGAAATSSVFAAIRDERIVASAVLDGPKPAPTGDRHAIVEELRRALLASMTLGFAQGFRLLDKAAGRDPSADPRALARRWADERRSSLLAGVAEALERRTGRECVLLDARIKSNLDKCLPALRRVTARSLESGLALPAMTSCLQFYDELRSTDLPTNLVAALRDSAGGEGFERADRPRGELFHSEWR